MRELENDILKIIEDAEKEAEQIRAAAREEAAALIAEAEKKAAARLQESQAECEKIKRRKLSEAVLIAENKEAIRKREIEDEVRALKAITSNKIDSVTAFLIEKTEAL